MKDNNQLTEEFYSKPFYLSYSGLNKLLFSPNLFYRHYILQQREEKIESYLIDGKVVHCLLLDDGSFDEQFIVTPKSLPTENTRIIVDRVYRLRESRPEKVGEDNLQDYSADVITELKNINLHQSLKTDQQRLDKIITDESKSYWEFLKMRGSKTLLDDETLTRCKQAVEALRSDTRVCDLLGLFITEMENVNVYNELPLEAETDYPFGLKGIVDNIKMDLDKKILYINDLKTTGKTISDFSETVDYYNYWAQAAIYDRLVRHKFSDQVDDSWTVVFNFIVIDKYQQVYSFQVSAGTMLEWQLKLEQKLKEAKWHYERRNYSLPYKFAVGQVIL